ncbi:MAG: hydrogen gas-evolving membrane-bound hydrogenase subunit E [Ignavibacteriaceae bacterium]
MRFIQYSIILVFGLLLIYATLSLPFRGPASKAVGIEKAIGDKDLPSEYYIKNAYKQTNTPNIVTVVLGDYRSIDTLGEEAVIFTAGIICFMLLMREKKK